MENTKEKEIWREVPGYKNYQVSDRGRIKSLDRTVIDSRGRELFYRGKILKGNINKNTGYRQFTLSANGRYRAFTASQIVALAFLGHSVNGYTKVIDHVNGVKTDDRLSNLRIVSHRKNTTTCFRKNSKTLSSRYIGVSWSKSNSKWRAEIQYEGEVVYLGCYSTEIGASNAYQKALGEINDNSFNPDEYKPNFISKFKGISFNKQVNKWVLYTYVDNKQKHLGYFKTEIEAYQALEKFKQNLSQKNRKKEKSLYL